MARRDQRLKGFAIEMRKDPTLAELRLWRELRGRRLGVRFRRQEPIGRFIVDFVCLKKNLVVEVDGDSHEDLARDAKRDHYLKGRGFLVLHIDNDEVLSHIDETITLIQQALDDPNSIVDPRNLDSFSPLP
jgi:leucyl-tRNA synthetase